MLTQEVGLALRVGRRSGWLVTVLALSACSVIGPRDYDPNQEYTQAEERALLEVPPELAGTSREAVVRLPEARDRPISRSILLPASSSARLVRDGRVSWLEIETDARKLWPELKAFMRNEKMKIARDEPPLGLLRSEWHRAGDGRSARSGGKSFERVSLRIEWIDDGRLRLFVRQRRLDVTASDTPLMHSSDPEREAELLAGLLLYLGLQEQQARGILTDEQVQRLSSTVDVQDVDGQPTLVVADVWHRVWLRTADAIERIGLDIERVVPSESRYEVLFSDELPEQVVATLPPEQRPESGLFGTEDVDHYYQIYVLDEPGQTRISIADTTGSSKLPALEAEIMRRLREELL